MIAFERIGVTLGERSVLREITFSLGEGERVALVGPSGSGKSTLVRVAAGLLAPDAGAVRIGEQLASEPARVRLPPGERGVAVVFQDLGLWPHMSAREHLRFAGADGRAAGEWLARVGLARLAGSRPGTLSGGERQRLALARALVRRPRVVLLDEPFSGLDVALRAEIRDVVDAALEGSGAAALLVTHEASEAVSFGDRVIVLEAGRVVADAPPAELPQTTPFLRVFAHAVR